MREWILENTTVTAEEYDSLINSKTLNIIGESKPIQKERNKTFEHPMLAIDLFTRQKPTLSSKIKYRVISKKQHFVHKKIKFIILADLLEEMKEILYSANRKRRCFELSLEILKKYNNVHIVTAMCIDPHFKEPTPFLHAITLVKDELGNEVILDATYNIAIKKETYINLLKANIISIISREKFKNDFILINELLKNNSVYLDEYLCFPDQVVTAAKKLTKAKN